jgi:signal transduction histidine kinase
MAIRAGSQADALWATPSLTEDRLRPLDTPRRESLLTGFVLLVVVPTLAVLAALLARQPDQLHASLVLWGLAVAAAGLFPVRLWRGIHLSMEFPILMAVGLVHAPAAAALTALVAVTDRRELTGEIGLLRALFNRSQGALAVLASSAAFHALTDIHRPWSVVVGAALIAAVADYAVNVPLVATAVSLSTGDRFLATVRGMWIGRLGEYAVNYVGLAFIATALAKFSVEPGIGLWALPALLVPLLFARQMFVRTTELERSNAELITAQDELRQRQGVLEMLSNRMAEERQDERAQIAAYLHDDLAQYLFRLGIQADSARVHLDAGDAVRAEADMIELREIGREASSKVRNLIRELDRSPLGPAGLAEAVRSFTEEIGRGSSSRFHVDIADLSLPPPIQVLLYHVAREAAMNAMKHASAANIWITLARRRSTVDLIVRDDGRGFDTREPRPGVHFGLTLMRERAGVGNGTFELDSAPGRGSTVTVRLPSSWLTHGSSRAPSPVVVLEETPVVDLNPEEAPAPKR